MKRAILAAAAVAIFALAGVATAADTSTLTVQASVLGTCRFSSGASTLNFGILDPSLGGDVTVSTSTQFWCTKGVTTDAAGAGNGANWDGSSRNMLIASGSDLIPYSLSLTPDGLANAGPTVPRTLTIAGTVLGSDYTGKAAGDYSDTVTITINP